ncbi:MAG: acetoacetate decarboxylase family protein [Methylocella sp.]
MIFPIRQEGAGPGPVLRELVCPNFPIKIILHVDGGPRICGLVRYRWGDVSLKGASSGPAAHQLFAHAMGNVAKFPVLNVRSGTHFVADVTLGMGEVVHDYLARGREGRFRTLPRGGARPMNEMCSRKANALGDISATWRSVARQSARRSFLQANRGRGRDSRHRKNWRRFVPRSPCKAPRGRRCGPALDR